MLAAVGGVRAALVGYLYMPSLLPAVTCFALALMGLSSLAFLCQLSSAAPLEKLTVERINSDPSLSGDAAVPASSGIPTASGSLSCAAAPPSRRAS